MNCQDTEERLPWLLGGGLSPEEATATREHLAGCVPCRQALQDTRRAADVFAAHLPAAVLGDLAWDSPGSPLPSELIQRHLASCPECAEELSLLRESRALEGATELARPVARRPLAARLSAWAAPLAAGLVIGLGWGALRNSGPVAAPPSPAAADPELQRLRDENASLHSQVQDARAPQVNLPLVELFPRGAVQRSTEGRVDEVVIPSGARQVALLLAADAPASRLASMELRGPGGETLWSGSGLQPGAQGAYTVAVPAALLADGVYTVAVRPQGAREIRYTLRVRHARTGAL